MKTMLKTTVAALALLSGVAAAPAVQAKFYTLGHSGAWTVSGGRSTQGNPLCVMQVDNRTSSVMLKVDSSTPVLLLHIFETGWQIPSGQPVPVELQVDNAPALTLNGHGINIPGGSSGIEAIIGANDPSPLSQNTEMVDLINLIGSGVSMRLAFPNGDEPVWTASLRGSNGALATFTQCVAAIYGQPTQPFGQPTAVPTVRRTQPF